MAEFDLPTGLAQRAIREGVSASDALAKFREGGGRVRTQTWYRLYAQAGLEGLTTSSEIAAPLHRTPVAGEIQTATSRRATGFMQRVTVMGRDAEGNVISQFVSFRTDKPVSRQSAIDRAVSIVGDAEAEYPIEHVIGGFYTGTFAFEPE